MYFFSTFLNTVCFIKSVAFADYKMNNLGLEPNIILSQIQGKQLILYREETQNKEGGRCLLSNVIRARYNVTLNLLKMVWLGHWG